MMQNGKDIVSLLAEESGLEIGKDMGKLYKFSSSLLKHYASVTSKTVEGKDDLHPLLVKTVTKIAEALKNEGVKIGEIPDEY